MKYEDVGARSDDITIGLEAMEQEVRPRLELNHLIPSFTLQSSDGKTISTADFKERKNLLVVFFDLHKTSDWEALAEIRRRYHEFTDANAEVLAISTGPIEELKDCAARLDVPYPLLCDCRAEAICAFCVRESTIFVADRFGELKLEETLDGDLDAKLSRALSALELVELECPECGVSTWPQF